MNTKLYVGNLRWGVSDEDLGQLFTKAGEVISAQVIIDRDTQRSRGFGFVKMNTEAEAKKAIETLNGHHLKGRDIVVKEALPEGNKRSADPMEGTAVVYIDSDIHAIIKRQAKESGRTIREIVESAIKTIIDLES